MLNFLKNKAIKNAGWIIGERIVQMALSLVVSVLSARYLGLSNYGSLNYTASFVTFFSVFVTLGMDGVVIKKLIADPEKEGELLGGGILLRAISSVICSVVIVTVVALLNPGDTEKLILVSLQSVQLLFLSVNLLDAWFQRYLKSRYVSLAKIVASVIVMGYKLWLLATAKSVEWFAFSNSLTAIIEAVVLLFFYKKSSVYKIRGNIQAGIGILKESYHYVLSGMMISWCSQMDKIMIGKMLSDASVGLYTVGVAVCNMWTFVPIAIINSFRPSILSLRQSGRMELYNLRLRQLYSFVIWLCLGVSVVVYIMAPTIIYLLYGQDYIGAAKTLKIAIWFETFSMIGVVRSIWLLAEDKSKYTKYFLVIGTGVNLVLNISLIPAWGIEGAALATLITQITTSVIAPMMFKPTREHTKIVFEAFCLTWWKDRKHLNEAENIPEK